MRFGSGGVGRIHNRKSRPRAAGLPATSLWSFLHAPAGYTPRTTGWAMKKADIAAFFDRLAAALPEPKGELEYVNAYTLLVAVVLSARSEEHTSELQSLMRISYAVFCLTTK